MTLPTAQNCDVVITTASNTATMMMMAGSGPQVASSTGLNNSSGSIATSAAANQEEVDLDLMMTATPPDGDQASCEQSRMATTTTTTSNDDNNNEIIQRTTTTTSSEEEEDDEEEEDVDMEGIRRSGTSAATKISAEGQPQREGHLILRPSCQMQSQQQRSQNDDDDSDMFGPPRSAPLLNSNRPRVPMISAKLRLREERKRILQLCANKLEKIKDSETNLRRSVCINNTYSRLTEEVRREKQSRYLANLPKCDSSRDTSAQGDRRGCCRLTMPNQSPTTCFNHCCSSPTNATSSADEEQRVPPLHPSQPAHHHHHHHQDVASSSPSANHRPTNNTSSATPLHNNNNNHQFRDSNSRPPTPINPSSRCSAAAARKRAQVDDLETLDREINALDAAMPPTDPEIVQGAEQLEKAVVSRKRTRMEECLADSDRFFALSQFYFPSPRLLTGIEDVPTGGGGGGGLMDGLIKRPRLMGPGMSFDSAALVDFDFQMDHHHQREFEVIMETLRYGPTMVGGGGAMAGGGGGGANNALQASNATTAPATDSCGHAAMLSEQCNGGGFHGLVVASLET